MKLSKTILPALLAALFCVVTCAGEHVPQFDENSAWNLLLDQCALGPRVPGSNAHAEVLNMIQRELRRNGWDVEIQKFKVGDPYGEGDLELSNVLAKLRKDKKKRVLLAAHFDTRPWADSEEADSLRNLPIPGANDGASGVAVLLELARLLGANPPGDLGIDMVFFDGEDYGRSSDLKNYLLGSKYYAARLSSYPRGYHPVCGILLDMVGAEGAKIFKELNSLRMAPEVTEAVFTRAGRLGLGVFVSRPGRAMYDDHIPLLMAGIKTVDLIDANYPYWHTLADTPDKCSKDTLKQVGLLLVDFLYDFPF